MAEKSTLRLLILCNKLYGVRIAQWSVVSPLALEEVGVRGTLWLVSLYFHW